MYWYLRKPEDSPRKVLEVVQAMHDALVCPQCNGDLVRARFTSDDSVGAWCGVCKKRFSLGKVKSKWNNLDPKKKLEYAKLMDMYNNAKGRYLYEPNDKERWFFLQPHMIKGISGGNRCLSGDSLIFDPVLDDYRRLDEIKDDFHVLAHNGKGLVISKANKPFLKGYDYLYRIELSNGKVFVSTLGHLVLTHLGYKSIDLSYKHGLFLLSPLPTNSDASRLTRDVNDPSCVETIQDSQDDYRFSDCFCGEPLLLVSDSGQDVFPLQGGVHEHKTFGSHLHMDDQAYKSKHNHLCQLYDHLSTLDVQHLNEGQFFDIECYFSCKPFESILKDASCSGKGNAASHQSISEFFHRQSIYESDLLANQSFYSYSYPFCWVTIVNITPISTDVKPYYDFHVPRYNNYLYQEIIHHNSGKTATCSIDLLMQCEGWHPLQRHNLEQLSEEALDEDIRKHCTNLLAQGKWIASPPVDARVVAVDFPNGVEKFVGPEIKKWSTRSEVKYYGFDNEKKRRINWNNGSFAEFMSTDQDLDAHGGSARDVIQVDEECPQEYWTENMMRIISKKGRMFIGATAVNGVTWTENEIWLPGENNDPDIYTIEMSTYDNPVNTAEIIDKIKRQCRDEVDVAIRIHGKRTLRGGHVYKMYRETYPWVVEPFVIPKDGMLVLAIDTHLSIPHAVLWIWVDYEGYRHPLVDGKPNLYEVACLFENGTIPDLVEKIRNMEATNPYLNGRGHNVSLLEPAAWNSDQTKIIEKSVYEQFVDNGIYPERASKDLDGGIMKVSELLMLEGEHPRLMTFKYDAMDYLLFEKRNYHFPDPRKALEQGRTPKQKPVDKDDHLMECERRIVEYVNDHEYDAMDMESIPQLMSNGSVIDVDFTEDEYEILSEMDY